MTAALLLCLALAMAAPAQARELWSAGEFALELSGSLREVATLTDATDVNDFNRVSATSTTPRPPLGNVPTCGLVATFPGCPAFDEIGDDTTFASLTRLRLQFDARLGERLSATVAYDHEWSAATRETFERGFGRSFGSERLADLEWEIATPDRSTWRHLLYRAFVAYQSPRFELTVGRQRIPWGVGRLWNPIDRFNPVPPLAIEADQSQGVDAVKARYAFSGFTFWEAIYSAGQRGKDRSYATRFGTVFEDVDLAAMAGVFEQAPTFGFDLATNLWDAAGRIEAVWTDPERQVRPIGQPWSSELPPYWQVVVSVDHNFDWGEGVYVLVEYLYNGNALGFGRGKPGSLLPFFQETDVVTPFGSQRVPYSGDADLFGSSRVVSRGRHLTGGQIGYDLFPEVRAEVVALYDWDGRSASFFPSLRYSPFGWLELTLGAQFFAGTRRSEYGNAEPLGFLIAEAFF